MKKLVFITGDFCSGSTLLFTVFRGTGQYYCLYEPDHQFLRQYLIWPLRVYEHHFFVSDYFHEYKGFDQIPRLHNAEWSSRRLWLTAEDSADDFYRYTEYL